LTDGETGSLPIPAHAELVIEGTVSEGDVLPEGPLGEFTGYYGRERSPQPVIEVKAVHHRKSPILTTALMAKYPSCEIGAYRHHALGPHPRRSGADRRAGRGRRLRTSGRGVGLGYRRRLDATAVRRPRRAGPRADRAMPGGGLLHQMDHRGGRRRRPDRLERS